MLGTGGAGGVVESGGGVDGGGIRVDCGIASGGGMALAENGSAIMRR